MGSPTIQGPAVKGVRHSARHFEVTPRKMFKEYSRYVGKGWHKLLKMIIDAASAHGVLVSWVNPYDGLRVTFDHTPEELWRLHPKLALLQRYVLEVSRVTCSMCGGCLDAGLCEECSKQFNSWYTPIAWKSRRYHPN